MLNLPEVTLIALTNKDISAHEEALRKSSEGINWGERKLIVDYGCTSIDEWNRRIIYELHQYVQTPFCMLIHADGYVVRPDLWRNEWLQYDFIGAPWPLPQDNFSYRDPAGNLVRVGNSVSLRSAKLLRLPTELQLEWRPYYGYTNEDGFLCCHNKQILEEHGIRFAPLSEAIHFSKEHEIEQNKGLATFAFHSIDI
jgi:hypothetical protein